MGHCRQIIVILDIPVYGRVYPQMVHVWTQQREILMGKSSEELRRHVCIVLYDDTFVQIGANPKLAGAISHYSFRRSVLLWRLCPSSFTDGRLVKWWSGLRLFLKTSTQFQIFFLKEDIAQVTVVQHASVRKNVKNGRWNTCCKLHCLLWIY